MTISSPSASSASPAPLASGKPDRESGCVACPPACDCHFHVFTARESSPGARYQPAYTASFGDWRALSGKAGIGRGIVVQPSFLGVDNRVLLQTLEDYRTLWAPVAQQLLAPYPKLGSWYGRVAAFGHGAGAVADR